MLGFCHKCLFVLFCFFFLPSRFSLIVTLTRLRLYDAIVTLCKAHSHGMVHRVTSTPANLSLGTYLLDASLHLVCCPSLHCTYLFFQPDYRFWVAFMFPRVCANHVVCLEHLHTYKQEASHTKKKHTHTHAMRPAHAGIPRGATFTFSRQSVWRKRSTVLHH